MGCDIHFTIERNSPYGWYGEQRAIPEKARDTLALRDYNFFGDLAGVRYGGPMPNGLPEDASPLTRVELDYWGSDAHSVGHCSLEHFVKTKLYSARCIAETTKRQLLGSDVVLDFLKIQDFVDVDIGDPSTNESEKAYVARHRVIYWFDN